MLSSSSKLPEREIVVCRRIAEVRELLSLEQKQLAKILKITRSNLANVENLRAPVRYIIGDRLCAALDLNQRWLATGELPTLRYFSFAEGLVPRVKPRSTFLEIYNSFLKVRFEESLKDETFLSRHPTDELDFHLVSNNEWKIRRKGGAPEIDPASLLCPLLVSNVRSTFAKLAPELRSLFYRHLNRSILEFMPIHYLVIDGVEKGPASIVLLQEILARDVAPGTTLVRTEGRPGHRTLTDLIANSTYRAAAKQWFRAPPVL